MDNEFSINGRPRSWSSPEELEKDIKRYFEECDNNTTKVYVKNSGAVADVPDPVPYTIEGLCDVLDCDRRTLLNYQSKEGYEEFFHTIKKAKNKIQRNKVERGLMGNSNPAVTIFDLKNNHEYRDSIEHNVSENTRNALANLDTLIRKQADLEQ